MRLLLLLTLCFAPTPLRAQTGNYSDASLERLNLKFRSLYARARSQRIVGVSPILIARGDSLVLIRNNERTEGTVVSPNYHDLKTIAHIPLGIFCVVSGTKDKLTADDLKQLQEYCTQMKAAEMSLSTAFPDEALRERQQAMMTRCIAFTGDVIEQGRCDRDTLDEFVDDLRPDVLKNVETATRLRIDNYHQQMKQWRPLLSAEEWQRLYVIIPGAALPRKNSMAVQYFAKLLQEPGEGRRIIYAESQFEESRDLLLLGTHILDAEAARAFFNDPWRLQRDMLGAAADSYLDTLDFDDFESP